MSTIKQKKVAELIIKNKGNVSKSMIEAGYSKASAKNPIRVTGSKGWNELVADNMPQDVIAVELRALLDAKEAKWFVFPTRMKDEDIEESVRGVGFKVICIRPSPIGKMAWYSIANNHAKKDALDLYFKITGKYAPEQITITKRKYQDLTNEELIAKKNSLQDFLRKK